MQYFQGRPTYSDLEENYLHVCTAQFIEKNLDIIKPVLSGHSLSSSPLSMSWKLGPPLLVVILTPIELLLLLNGRLAILQGLPLNTGSTVLNFIYVIEMNQHWHKWITKKHFGK